MATLKVTNIKNESFAGDQLYLKSDGKIGIGTTSPQRHLVLYESASGQTQIQFQNSTTGSASGDGFSIGLDAAEKGFIWNYEGTDTYIGGAGGTSITIKNDGKVGIGTTSPGYLLHIKNAGTADTAIKIESESGYDAYLALDSSNGGGAETDIKFQMDGTTKGTISYVNNAGSADVNCMIFRNNANTERMKIKADGNIEVGGNLKTNNLPGKNLVINGAMKIAQRGTSATSSSSQYKTVDRFSLNFSGTDEAPTESQHALTSSDTGPWEEGFRHSFHLQNGNQTGGADANDFIQPQYKFEAQDIANSGWNYTSSSSYVTLSFWIKVSVAGDYTFDLTAFDGTAQRYPTSTGNLSANTWTKITKNIPGNSNLQFDLNNAVGLSILWYPFLGTTYTASVTANQWQTAATGNYGTTNTTSWWTTNDSTWEITGVQLEIGSIATEFEHRSYGEELARCQRYYWQVKQDGTSTSAFVGSTISYGSNYNIMMLDNPVEMRVACNALTTGGTAADYQLWGDNNVVDLSTLPSLRATSSKVQSAVDVTYNVSAGNSRIFRIKGSTSAYLGFNAEL